MGDKAFDEKVLGLLNKVLKESGPMDSRAAMFLLDVMEALVEPERCSECGQIIEDESDESE